MTQVFLNYIDLTLTVAMVTENGRQYRLNRTKCHFGPKFGDFQSVLLRIRYQHNLIPKIFLIYTASKFKHHPNIISETFFINDFLQKNNLFVRFCYLCLSMVCQSYQTVIGHFCYSSTVSCIHQFLLWGIPFKVS